MAALADNPGKSRSGDNDILAILMGRQADSFDAACAYIGIRGLEMK